MSRIDDLREVMGEIERYEDVADRILQAIARLRTEDLPAIGKTTTTAIAAAQS
jgi:broad specificity phosphatase PhoE